MDNINVFISNLYEKFNQRDIQGVVGNMTPDVKWANGMEGGFVYGHEGVTAYWTRQFGMMTTQVTPLEIEQHGGDVLVKVHQVAHDLSGQLLNDSYLSHVFTIEKGKVKEFNIR